MKTYSVKCFAVIPTERYIEPPKAPILTIMDRVHLIRDNTARYFHLPVEVLIGKSRKHEIVVARHAAIYLTTQEVGRRMTMEHISAEYGGMDHTSAIHAVKATIDRLETGELTQDQLQAIMRGETGPVPARLPKVHMEYRRNPNVKKIDRPQASYTNTGHLQLIDKLTA